MSAVSAQISTILHATEDPDRVKRALDHVCPRSLFEPKTEERKLKGHYGNEIVTVTLNVQARFANSFFQRLMTSLRSSDRAVILHDFESRLDPDGNLHLRLDKQESLRQNFSLKDQDPIKIQVAFRTKGASRAELYEQIRELSEM